MQTVAWHPSYIQTFITLDNIFELITKVRFYLCYFCLFFVCFRACLFIDALWSPAWKGLTSWLSFLMSNFEVVTFPLVSWDRCGARLYRFLIFAPFLFFKQIFWIYNLNHHIGSDMPCCRRVFNPMLYLIINSVVEFRKCFSNFMTSITLFKLLSSQK